MAKVTITVEDQVSGEYDGAVGVQWNFEPPLVADEELTGAQMQALSIKAYMDLTSEIILGSEGAWGPKA